MDKRKSLELEQNCEISRRKRTGVEVLLGVDFIVELAEKHCLGNATQVGKNALN